MPRTGRARAGSFRCRRAVKGDNERVTMSDARLGPQYSVRVVAERVGVPTATLRSWSRRYGIGPQGHRAGRHRHYTTSDIAVVEQMVALVRRGVRPASAARTALESEASSPAALLDPDRLVDAAYRMDAGVLLDRLRSSIAAHGVVVTWEQLCRPAFAQIEVRQSRGEGCIDVEHLLSWAVAAGLHQVTGPSSGDPVPLLLTCVEDDLHTLPLEALRAALAERERPAQMLGPVPSDALVAAIDRRSAATTVVIWAQHDGAHTSMLQRAVRAGARVFAAGPGWTGTRLPDKVALLTDLDSAVRTLTATRPSAADGK